MAPQGRKIVIVGGTGTVGLVILPALLSRNIHTITAISRDQDILPTQFGRLAMDTQDVLIRAVVKTGRRKLVEELGGSWIAVVNNPWFDWSMGQGLWGIDIKARKATLYSGGNTKANTSTLQGVGEAVAELLSVYVSSFYITQREMLESVQRVTGTTDKDWVIEDKEIAEVVKESDEELKKGNMMAMIPKLYSAHFREGYGGDFNHKVYRIGIFLEGFDAV
ncbi:hypothetical protein EDB80DRAFT_754214 [Ilyonectria destructans]|nr:hypothetical protein EDB80DRAFT_754214 [Ilyonectria destructans]